MTKKNIESFEKPQNSKLSKRDFDTISSGNRSYSKSSIEINKIKPKIVRILKKHKVSKAGIFGSYARGEAKKNSDVDILIKFNGGLLSLVNLERELEESLGKKVDLLPYGGIHRLLKKRILKEEVRIL